MTRRASGLAVFAALLSFALPAMSQQYYLYSPKAVSPETKANKADREILVSEIVIKKGDTLSALSRKYSGKGSYYPQILLFNDIKNPHLIRTGASIRVPVKREAAVLSDAKSKQKFHTKVGPAKKLKAKAATAPVSAVAVRDASKQQREVTTVSAANDQKLFEQGSKAYRSGDCRSAIETFDRLLADYSGSPLAADASLYKADCLLKLSGQ